MKKMSAIILCLALGTATGSQQMKPLVLRGEVVDSDARPVAGAEVVAYQKCTDYYRGPEYAELLSPASSGHSPASPWRRPAKRTDSNGGFALNVRTDDQYNVFIVARKPGLAAGWDGLNYSLNHKAEGNFHIILEKPGLLAGKLVDTNGKPVAGAAVQAVPVNSYLYRLRQRPILAPKEWFITESDATGSFRFNNLPLDAAADFMVQVPGRSVVYWYTPCHMSSCGYEVGKKDVRLVLSAETRLQGQVIGGQGRNRFPGVRMVIQPHEIRDHEILYRPYEVSSQEDGTFSVKGLPPGKHILRVLPPTEGIAEWIGRAPLIDVRPAETTKTTVQMEKGGVLEVRTCHRGTKRPLAGIKLGVHNANFSAFEGDFGFYHNARTGGDGIARIRVPLGQCKITAWSHEYRGEITGVPATVTRGRPSRVQVPMDRQPKIHGTAVDQSGRPVARAFVQLHPFGDEAFTDSRGRFKAMPDRRHPAELVVARDVRRNLAGVAKIADVFRPVKVTLRPALSITGKVADSAGAGVPAARVSLVMSVSHCSSGLDEVVADSKGHYEMNAIPPEQDGFEYRVSVHAAGYGPNKYEKVSIKGSAQKPVDVPAIALIPADASISGVVVDADGKPVARRPVFVGGTLGFDQPERTGVTDAQGRFAINRICKGPLTLQASFPSWPGGVGRLHAQGGDRGVEVILGQEGSHTRYASLVGKPLPDLSGFGLDNAAELIEGKEVLVCFWDMQQRPSRRFMSVLVGNADNLKAKDVVVICIQASEVNEDALGRWVKEQNIPFPIGLIRGDTEQIKSEWGVSSLPWLISTNQNHIVTGEGFALKEFHEKMSATKSRRCL
jgi:hypothetical protein